MNKQNWVPCLIPRKAWRIVEKTERKSPLHSPSELEAKGVLTSLRAKNPNTQMCRIQAGTGRPLHCAQNVQQYIDANGGEALHGLIVWCEPLLKDLKFEAHVVVKTPTGHLVDVTSYFGGDKTIVFTF